MNQNVHIGGSNGKVYLPWKFPYAARRAISPKHAQKVRNVLTGMVNGRYKALLENGLSNRNHRRYQIALRASGRWSILRVILARYVGWVGFGRDRLRPFNQEDRWGLGFVSLSVYNFQCLSHFPWHLIAYCHVNAQCWQVVCAGRIANIQGIHKRASAFLILCMSGTADGAWVQ